MREHEESLRSAGASVAAIGLGDFHYARLFREETGIEFPLLVDEERRAYRAAQLGSGSIFNLLRREDWQGRSRAREAGHAQRRLGKDPFQLGGSFVFAPGDVDLYAHLSRSFSDNAPVEELVAAVTGRS